MHIAVDKNLLESLLVLATVIEARDAYTGGHAWRVARYTELLAAKAGLSKDEQFLASLGGLVHDIGKIGVPDAILNKPDRLSDQELQQMQQHPHIGFQVVENHPLSSLIVEAVLQHHVRPDGKGYPAEKSLTPASAAPPYARMIALADAFDSMTSDRPYRKGMPLEKAKEIIAAGAGFAPEWSGVMRGIYTPAPDRDAVSALLNKAPGKLRL